MFLGRDFNSDKNYSEETAALIDKEIKRIITEEYERAERILREHREKMDFIAEYLVKNEVMDDRQFIEVMDGDPTIEQREEMVAERKRISDAENAARAERIREKERLREEERKRKEEAQARRNGSNGPVPPNPWIYPEPPTDMNRGSGNGTGAGGADGTGKGSGGEGNNSGSNSSNGGEN